jgi:integrase
MSERSLKPIIEDGVRLKDFFYDPKTKVIYFLKSLNNKKIKFSTKTKLPDTKKARRIANAELTKRLNKKKNRITPLIRDEIELWLKVKINEGVKYDTLNNIKRAKAQIEEYWGDKFCSEITRDNLADWYVAFKAEHPEIRMENAIKYMRNFARYLSEKVVNEAPLLAAVPPINDPEFDEIWAERVKKKQNIFSNADLKAIVETAESPEHQLLVLIMYTMATRITETLTMRFGHEVLMNRTPPIYRWTVGQNKADLVGEHTFHPVVAPRLEALKAKRDLEKTDRLFPQLRDNQAAIMEQQIDWDAWRKRANIGWHWTPHTFRHTCLSNLFNDEKNPQALIIKLYRVSLATALATYIKPTDEGREKMREAIKVEL